MLTFMKAREGDYIEDHNGIIFDVKGLIHPRDKIIAFPRFIPASNGKHRHADLIYDKIYSLAKRFVFLEENFPQYLVYDNVFNERLCEVPIGAVKHHYRPDQSLKRLRSTDKLDVTMEAVLQFVEILKENSGVPWGKMGISGSIMVRLHTPSSDIDPIVYGSETGYKVHSALKKMLEDKDNPIKPYNIDGLRKLFDFRSKDTFTSFEDFVRSDSRKVSHGKFMGKDFFIRFVKDWNEVSEQYGSIIYKPVGRARIKATVVDDSESIFTPCSYKLSDVETLKGPPVESIEEIVSFRGRFCEQARSGEAVVAEGKVEKVQQQGRAEHYRLLIGNKPSDYMILTF
jgi:predicted nucleotidyltransferase